MTIESAIQSRLQGFGLESERADLSAIEFYVRLFQDRCTISFNTSGGHLHNRGLQIKVGTAPIRGTLAASILTLSKAFDHDLVLDPFCGSGTLLIEGVYIAHNVPPGRNRQFSFEAAPFYKESAWHRIRSDAERATRASETRFIGIDILEQSIINAYFNVEQTGLNSNVSLFQRDTLECNLSKFLKGSKRPLIVSNLPYGKRIGNRNSVPTLLLTFFRKIRQELPGCHYAFITKHPGLLTQAGIPPEKTLHSSNGGLAVTIALGKIPERS